jgi:transcriptional regulator with XRE-family HTH domain
MKIRGNNHIGPLEKSTKKRIGERIKSARVQRNFSLNDLANMSEVSASTIHKIENYAMVPTVTTLLKIAKGLEKDLHFFIDEADSQKDYKVIRQNEAPLSSIKPQKKLIRALSSKFANTHLEVHYCTIYKDGSSGKKSLLHDSEEVAICLKGRIEYFIDRERIMLEPFDSIHIKGGVRHRWRNIWSGKTETLFIFSPPLFS